ncbi:LPS export ABC transporter periplasmic protein LptC [Stutzerimonas kirkiae]|uniref:Lipopolysaccharide export system protein LptC n=1 Tax=Stutzerimonas kirkiae TaxID=2211392 RepID=A0A4Q9RCL9_9GAMM|nr:LPS export ABC transporter periplasmic protein LptC [Stutzerimonas kirkiae]TBU98912.1 LPS export ABC transporter periplasmic protein LptC [Stutzerimonas kirkiae]TBV01562.1 LPS export ABC transporter periplasmic protein LptC [Stutzerimonas kirkiae]TBV10334.1 LPS export ABC transporter periplasmic protein LptC [Stutzerimonas kirkiae]TBV16873.1 LPS export ABC transporter periplasmic protein LptC [Stutzerimonas kirkiae]
MLRKLRLPVILALAIALLVAVGYWNIRPESFMRQAETTRSATPAVDFYVLNSRTVQYQADGKLDYIMTSEKLEHIDTTDISLLTRPDLHSFRGSEHPWHIRSERGEVSPGGEEIELMEQVRVERTDAKGRQTILTTSRLTVQPDKDYAETRQPVRIEAANGVTTATGMKTYLNEGRMLLLSNVRGQHELR